jgi:hypothetical protein
MIIVHWIYLREDWLFADSTCDNNEYVINFDDFPL